MKLNFRLANAADIPLLLELMRQFYAIDQYFYDAAIAGAALAEMLADETLGRVWLIETDDKTVGYIIATSSFSLEYGGRTAFVDELYLQAEARGKKIGTAAIAFVEKTCREWGVKALHLEVERDNESAQALYRKSGFESKNRFLMTRKIL